MTMAQQTLTAFFDTRTEAETAIDKLVAAGIPRNDVRIVAGAETTSTTQGTSVDNREDSGFFAALKDLFLPDEDRYTYAEGLRRGGVMVSASVDTAHIDRASDILEEYGAVDVDERETGWRSEGWTGYTGAGATTGEAMTGATGTGYLSGSEAMGSPGAASSRTGGTGIASGLASAAGAVASAVGGAARATGDALTGDTTTSRSTSTTGSALGAMGTTGAATTRTAGERDETIALVAEELRVGKRQVEGGRVKVRSYVVETPVEEQVTLREERVGIERVAVNRPVSAADKSLFQDRTIEATATSEEAVVSKEARVTAELRINKDVEQRTQTVKDTVRKTEVEVDDDRTGRTTPRTGTDTSRGS